MRNAVRILYCMQCGHPYELIEPDRRKRSKDHRKALYCVSCKQVVNHIPMTKEEFEEEYAAGTFKNEVSLDKEYIEDKDRKLENIYNFNRK